MTKTLPERKDMDARYQWATEDLYADTAAWEADLARLTELGKQLAGFAGKLCTDAGQLLAYLRLSDELDVLYDSLGNYAHRKSDEDTRVSENQALVGRLSKAGIELSQYTSFEVPELLSISDEAMEAFYRQEPDLELYRVHLDNVRRKKAHVLSQQEEKLLAGAHDCGSSAQQIFSMFNNADLKFEPAADKDGVLHPISQGSYIPALESADRVLRKNAFENYYASYSAFRNTLAGMLSAQVRQLEFFAKARSYPAALDAALDRTNVPTSVYHNLIDAVHQNLDKMHRYVKLRKKLLGLDELHMYDLYTPLVEGVDEKIDFEDAKKTVVSALACLGEDYTALLQKGFDSRWIDVYENAGKRSGAYSAGARVHPYVLLNYAGTLDSQFTLAHEMGHALHSYYSNHNQPVVYSDYVIFVAEVASTCNEALLMEYLLSKTTDKKQRAYLLNHFLEQFRGTLYRQTMFAEFELRIAELNWQNVTLTADVLCREYKELNRKYFGDEIILDEQIAMEWARIPHFYYNYYVFQYATGYAAAIALSRQILKEGEPAVKRYLGFLSGGCSKSPIELLKGAGVDMTTAEPVNQALSLFGELLDEMEKLMQE